MSISDLAAIFGNSAQGIESIQTDLQNTENDLRQKVDTAEKYAAGYIGTELFLQLISTTAVVAIAMADWHRINQREKRGAK